MSLRSVRLVLLATAALLLAPSVASAAWTVTPTPNAQGPRTFLSGVACSSASSCIAVGSVDFGTATPLRLGAGHRALGRHELADHADAQYVRGAARHLVPAAELLLRRRLVRRDIELWDGTSWSIQPSPPAERLARRRFLLRAPGLHGGWLREHWPRVRTLARLPNAGTARLARAVHPGPPGSDNSHLSSVSCPLKRTCTAVGQSTAGPCDARPSSSAGSGVSIRGPSPRRSPKAPRALRSAASPVRTDRVCFAVGVFRPPPGDPGRAPQPARRGRSCPPRIRRPPRFFPSSHGVSCPGLRACHAVGTWFRTIRAVFAERFDGASWQLEGSRQTGARTAPG